jgi:hypothetical protein
MEVSVQLVYPPGNETPVEVKLSLCLIKYHAMKTCEKVEVWLHRH